MEPPVVIYTTAYCPYCVRAKELLHQRGIVFREIDVTGDDVARQRLIAMTGGRKTVPQIFIHGQPIGGYTDLRELDTSGRLRELLQSSAVGPRSVKTESPT